MISTKKNIIISKCAEECVEVISNLDDIYTFKSAITGDGSATMTICHDKVNNRNVVIKKISIISSIKDYLTVIREIRIHEKMSRLTDKVVNLYGYGLDNSKNNDLYAVLIMEYIEGWNMKIFADNCDKKLLSAQQIARFGEEICSVVNIMHKENIVHRDIKPENIMISKTLQLKIIDFGMSSILGDPKYGIWKGLSGTPVFLSPEIFMFKNEMLDDNMVTQIFEMNKEEIFKCIDIWAVGMSMYELMESELPWKGNTLLDLQEEIQNVSPIEFTYPDTELVRIVNSALHKNPKMRPRAHDLQKKFSDYITKHST